MAWVEKNFKLVGVAPLIMSDGKMADPLDPASKSLAQVTRKSKKTDADYEEAARREWFGRLYTKDVDGKRRVCIPERVIDGLTVEGAKKLRMGPMAKSGVYCKSCAPLIYDGPEDIEDLWKRGKNRITVGVRNQKARVMRTRPIFPQWTAAITLEYDDEQINESSLKDILSAAGKMSGIGDWRPRYGRFGVVAT